VAPTQNIRRVPAVVRLCLGLLLLVAVTAPAAQPSRIVAIGDVHGAIDELRALLEAAELTDGDQHWTGGNNTLVQTGDLTDRGAGVRAVLDLMMRLETDAAEAGGQVLVVLGNHETMSLMANLRDTTPALLAAFADAESEALREEGYADYLALAAARSDALGPLAPQPQSRSVWMDTHPPGFLEYIDAFGPDGRYGRWLRSKPVVVRVGDSIFLHGGLHPSAPTDLDEINEQARRELETYDRQRRQLMDRGLILPFSTFQETLATVSRELVRWSMLVSPMGPPAPGPGIRVTSDEREEIDLLLEVQGLREWSIIDENGPVWFRGLARWDEQEDLAKVRSLTERYQVARIVVGHTPQASRRIIARFENRVFLIDTGMLASAYAGRGSALEIDGGRLTAVYLDGRIPFPGMSTP
jgi:hypothetical protein